MQTFITQACTVGAAIGIIEAGNWINDGYGLNPFLALPAATIFILAPYVIAHFMKQS